MTKTIINKIKNVINNHKIITTVLIMLFLLLSLALTYSRYVKKASQEYYMPIYYLENSFDNQQYKSADDLADGTILEQSFVANVDHISGIKFQLKPQTGGDPDNKIRIELYGTELIQAWDVTCGGMGIKEDISLLLDEPLTNAKGSEYRFKITIINTSDELAIYTTSGNRYGNGDFYINGQQQNEDLAFAVLSTQNKSITTMFLLIAGAILLLTGAILYLSLMRRPALEKIYILAALTLGIIYMFILPPFSAPDEVVHFNTTYYHTSRILGQDTLTENHQIILREQDTLYFDLTTRPTGNDYAFVLNNLTSNTTDPSSTNLAREIIDSSMIQYTPQIIGVTLGRLLNVDYVLLTLMGRLSSLICFVLCVYFAIKNAPFGKMVLFIAGLLPITLELASSYSYDNLGISLSFLLTAYILGLAYKKDKVVLKDWIIIAVILIFLIPCKILYALLILLVFLIPREKIGNVKTQLMGLGIIGVGILGGLAASSMFGQAAEMADGGSNIIEWAGTEGYSLGFLIKHPAKTIKIYLLTLKEYKDFYFLSALGSSLGWLDIQVPIVYIIGYFISILLASLAQIKDTLFMKFREKLWCLVIIAGIIAAILMAMLLGWTPMFNEIILGVQGRYFIPIIPLLLILCRNKWLQLRLNIDYYLCIAVCMLQVLTVLDIFETVMLR